MKIARTKNAMKGITIGLIQRVFQMIVPFFMRTAMIQVMGVQYLGLNSLFTSVLHVLNLAELGVGSAMVFSMYKPIAEDDEATICALMKLYRRYYRIIGLIIGVVGLALTPAIPKLISGNVPEELSIYVLYWLNLGSTVLSYWLFAYRNCILQAHQRTYVVTIVTMITQVIQYALQLSVMLWVGNYYLYVVVLLLTTILNNVLTAVVAARKYPQYRPQGELPKPVVKQINRKIRDLFAGKLCYVVGTSTDTIVISAFLGLSVLAVYQNYYYVLSAVIAVLDILMSSIRAGLGNSFVAETREKNFQDMDKFTFLYTWAIGVGACCFLTMYQPFMEIWVGRELMLGWQEVICFVVYFYVFAVNKLLNVYKDSAGLWHEDKFRLLVVAFVNLSLNLLWVRSWGLRGVIVSTVISQLFVGIPWVLYNLFRLFFGRSLLKGFCTSLLKYAGAALLAAVLTGVTSATIQCGLWLKLVLCFGISVGVPCLLFYVLFGRTRQFVQALQFMDRITGGQLSLVKRFGKLAE